MKLLLCYILQGSNISGGIHALSKPLIHLPVIKRISLLVLPSVF